MTEHLLTGLVSIIVLGVAAQWLAWRLKLPSILLLLTFGFIAGPITGLLHIDDLMGDLLFPIVSLSVGIIMFEGALGLKIADLRHGGRVIRNLITVGAAITWGLASAGAHLILGLSLPLAVLLGAILVVTGPTVIIPLLRHVRPTGAVGPILRWEGILIDPVGATLALLVFEYVLAASPAEANTGAAVSFFRTLVAGGAVGAAGAGVVYVFLRRYWVPDYLQNPMTLASVIAVFALADFLQHESGLLAVTVMGIALANQRRVPVKHIIEFKENIGVLLLAALFIMLSARLELSALTQIGPETILFILFLMLVVRPLSIFVCTLRSGLRREERLFLAWMAPRGIVAAAVTSIFALRLADAGYTEAEQLVPIMFSVIVVTVAIYGLTSLPLARWLKVTQPGPPQGILIVGGHDWARDIALALQNAGYRTMVVDTNQDNIQAARMQGLPTYYGSILSEDAHESLNLEGIGRMIALTSNDEVNSLAALHFAEMFGRAQVYHLPLKHKEGLPASEVPGHLRGRLLFHASATYTHLNYLFEQGAVVKTTSITRTFDYKAYRALHGDSAILMFIIDEPSGKLSIVTQRSSVEPQPGQTAISVVIPQDANP